jgi:hypothetical protein
MLQFLVLRGYSAEELCLLEKPASKLCGLEAQTGVSEVHTALNVRG